jgi:hypothetical protein
VNHVFLSSVSNQVLPFLVLQEATVRTRIQALKYLPTSGEIQTKVCYNYLALSELSKNNMLVSHLQCGVLDWIQDH